MSALSADRALLPSARRVVVVADDLTGAADTSAPFAHRVHVSLELGFDRPWGDASVLALDTDTRHASPQLARERVTDVVRKAASQGAYVYKKIDSLARGNAAVEIRAAADALLSVNGPHLVVVAPGFPSVGRTTVDGVIHVSGVPLAARGREVRVADLLNAQGFRTVEAPRPVGASDVVAALDAATLAGDTAIVIDARTDADLASIVEGTRHFPGRILLVGSGGLARPLAELVGTTNEKTGPARLPAPVGPFLIVVGSRTSAAAGQRRALVQAGVHPVMVSEERPSDTVRRLRQHLWRNDDVVLFTAPAAPQVPERAAAVSRALAAPASAVLDAAGTLVATGGETARAVLTMAGVERLRVLGELEPGLVLCRVDGSSLTVVTKAGSFGDKNVLVRCLPNRQLEEF